MTDQDIELWHKTAKAAGEWDEVNGCVKRAWCPLTSSADAFELMCKLSIRIVEDRGGAYRAVQFTVNAETEEVAEHEIEIEWPHTPAATRNALTKAAAAIQEAKEGV